LPDKLLVQNAACCALSRQELSAEAALVAQLKERLEETRQAVKEERTLADRLRAEAKSSSDSLSRKVSKESPSRLARPCSLASA
jgi:hypothetical protein